MQKEISLELLGMLHFDSLRSEKKIRKMQENEAFLLGLVMRKFMESII